MPTAPELQKIITTAIITGCEVTLDSLIAAINAQGMALDQLNAVRGFTDQYLLELVPPVTTGSFTSTRILRLRSRQKHTIETVLLELNQGEKSSIEFKSSLLYHHKRALAVPETPLPQLRSEDVLFSSLKTIAAFLNTTGGLLFVGVSDDALPIGLHQDCTLLECTGFNADRWQLELRNQIKGKFKDGAIINDYVDVSFYELEQQWIARVQVLPKRRLSFLKENKILHLYRRQGNLTMPVEIDELEDFLEFRRAQQGFG